METFKSLITAQFSDVIHYLKINEISLPTIIHILIQCILMLGYSFFSVIVGIIFQQFLKN